MLAKRAAGQAPCRARASQQAGAPVLPSPLPAPPPSALSGPPWSTLTLPYAVFNAQSASPHPALRAPFSGPLHGCPAAPKRPSALGLPLPCMAASAGPCYARAQRAAHRRLRNRRPRGPGRAQDASTTSLRLPCVAANAPASCLSCHSLLRLAHAFFGTCSMDATRGTPPPRCPARPRSAFCIHGSVVV